MALVAGRVVEWWGAISSPLSLLELDISRVVLSYLEKPDHDGHLLLEVDCSADSTDLLN